MNSPRQIFSFLILCLLFGCRPDAGTAAPGNDTSLPPVTFTQPWSPSATKTASNTGMAASSISSETRTLPPTQTPFPTQTKTSRPTFIPTPTRGLPPTITLSPKEECPPATGAKVEIRFSYEMQEYSAQILDYFRAKGDRADLEMQLGRLGTALFTEADVTGDQAKETILTFKQSGGDGYFMQIGIFIIGCRERQFRLMHAEYLRSLTASEAEKSGVADILDINADGLLEIILSRLEMQGTLHNDWSNWYNVIGWDGTRLRSLFERLDNYDQLPWIEATNSWIEIRDIDGNGTKELLFPNDFFAPYCGLGPYRLKKGIYIWDGEFYQFMWTDPGTPRYRFQAAFDGDYYAWHGLYDKSEKMYLKAINDTALKVYLKEDPIGGCVTPPKENPDEPTQIMAYTRFRIMELHAYLHKINEAENELNYLVSNYEATTPGYLFASWADIFWKAFQVDQNIDDACSAVMDAAGPYEKTGFGLMFYGDLNPGPTLDTICPFHSTAG